ncbi:hypothetical protein SS50377_25939 [Spironucleus salmonicida]|uniref:Uncharacterized protein n=1 Tax=Spironucleus salmonicida TaxID=348837 RepID=A0A9P8LP82_9EUKA|nr:hypothetical protein SS50377_25939 [Spironucleus salmonicida]
MKTVEKLDYIRYRFWRLGGHYFYIKEYRNGLKYLIRFGKGDQITNQELHIKFFELMNSNQKSYSNKQKLDFQQSSNYTTYQSPQSTQQTQLIDKERTSFASIISRITSRSFKSPISFNSVDQTELETIQMYANRIGDIQFDSE